MRINLMILSVFFATMIFPVMSHDEVSSVSESSSTVKNSACESITKDLELEISETENELKNLDPASKKFSLCEKKLELMRKNLSEVEKECVQGIEPDYIPKVVVNYGASKYKALKDLLLPQSMGDAFKSTGISVSGTVNDLKSSDPSVNKIASVIDSPVDANSEAQIKRTQIKYLMTQIFASAVVSPPAVVVAKSAVGFMLKYAAPKVVKNLAERDVKGFIISKDENLTDLAPFAHLKGRSSSDGRSYDDIRGLASYRKSTGATNFAFPEENLIGEKTSSGGYPKQFVFAHEFGHTVLNSGLPKQYQPPKKVPDSSQRRKNVIEAFKIGIKPQNGYWPDFSTAITGAKLAWKYKGGQSSYESVEEIYQRNVQRPEGTGLGSYSDRNESENFAQATAIYFSVGNSSKETLNASYLYERQPEMAMMMYQIYGPPRSMKK